MIKRVEILFPIYDVRLKERLKNILDIQLKDNVKARFQDANGDYHYVERPENEPVINSQKIFYEEVVRYHDAD
jgi:polyphosphate kinase